MLDNRRFPNLEVMEMIRIGQILSTQCGVFKVLSRLNHGALGEIYLAEVMKGRRRLQRTGLANGMMVAVKVPRLPDGISHSEALTHYLPTLAKSWIVEAHALSQLSGLDCVPRFFGSGTTNVWLKNAFGQEPVQMQFLVMEFLPGESLEQYLVHKFGVDGAFHGVSTADEFFRLANGLAANLLMIHRRQVVHGDVWPRNVMICENQTKFIDFGQAVRRDLSPGGFFQKLASHAYLPPDGSGAVAGDVYALAGVLFYLATGTVPPKGERDENKLKGKVLNEIRNVNPRLVFENRGIADIIARGLRIDPHRRLQSIDVLIDDLGLFSPASISAQKGRRVTIHGHLAEYEKKRHSDAVAGGMLDAFRSDDEISTFMTRLLSFLQPGDRYSTISLPKFWRQGNVGNDGRFMSMNIVKARQGVHIERVFLLRQSDLDRSEVAQVLCAQLRAVDEYGDCICRVSARRHRGCYNVNYIVLSEDEYDGEISHYSHAGLLLSAGHGSVVFSTYNADEKITSCRVQPVASLYGTQVRKFEFLQKRAKPLAELRDRLLEATHLPATTTA